MKRLRRLMRAGEPRISLWRAPNAYVMPVVAVIVVGSWMVQLLAIGLFDRHIAHMPTERWLAALIGFALLPLVGVGVVAIGLWLRRPVERVNRRPRANTDSPGLKRY